MPIDSMAARRAAMAAQQAQNPAPQPAPVSIPAPVIPEPEPVPPPVEAPQAPQPGSDEFVPHALPERESKPRKAVEKTQDTLRIPDFPASLMKMVRSEVRGSTNNSDALAAWVWVKSGRHEEVPERIRVLADSVETTAREDILTTLLEKTSRIERASLMSASAVSDEYYMLMWLMLERMAMINSPRLDTLDFTGQEFEQFRTTLKQRIENARNAQKIRDGRPYR